MFYSKKNEERLSAVHFWHGGKSWRDFYFVVSFPRLNWKQFRCDVNIGLGISLSLLFCSNGFSSTDSVFLSLPFLRVAFSTNQSGEGVGLKSLETGFVLSHDWAHVSIGYDDSGWSRSGWRFSFSPIQVLFGDAKYTKINIEQAERVVWIDKKQHALKIERFVSVRSWPRWPFERRVNCAEVIPTSPVTIPGKGENGWDYGSDAVYSLTVKCKSVDQAAEKFVENVLSTRLGRG